MSDNLRQKLVSKEKKVVSKNLEKAYIQLAAEINSGPMIVNCPIRRSPFAMKCCSNVREIWWSRSKEKQVLVLLFCGSLKLSKVIAVS